MVDTSPAFLDKASQGLLGLGYAGLSTAPNAPFTLLDAWVQNGMTDQIGFRACPYTRENQSYIDFGNTEVYSACGVTEPVATTRSPEKSYMTLDVKSISVNGVKTVLPMDFQSLNAKSERTWSILDSCTSQIKIPAGPLDTLQNTIIASNGMPAALTDDQVQEFLMGTRTIAEGVNDQFIWTHLPAVSFELATNSTPGTFNLILGPRQYIQRGPDGFCNK